MRDPKTGQGSTNFQEYCELLAKIRAAVPKLIIQVGGSISFAPHADDAKAKWLDYDTRHMLAEVFFTTVSRTLCTTSGCRRTDPLANRDS